MKLQTIQKDEYAKIEELYLLSFPEEERAPFSYLTKQSEQGHGTFLTAYDQDTFVGFIYLLTYEDLLYIFYLAIDDSNRQQGYGSKLLTKLFEEYQGYRIFLAREFLDETQDNYQQRILRHSFYQKNGFIDNGQHIQEGDVIYDVMIHHDGKILPQEYDKLINQWRDSSFPNIIMRLY